MSQRTAHKRGVCHDSYARHNSDYVNDWMNQAGSQNDDRAPHIDLVV